MTNLRELILKVDDIKKQPFQAKEWGVDFFIKEPSTKHMIEINNHPNLDKMSNIEYAAHMVIACAVDEDGNQIFKASDYDSLVTKSTKTILEISAAATGLMMTKAKAKKN